MTTEDDVMRAKAALMASAPITGRWHNRLGSRMDLTVGGDDVITGTFRTGVGTVHPERTYQLTGYALGNALVFCVDFRPHGSVAAWTGHHVAAGGADRLVTLWHLAQPLVEAHDEGDVWRGVLAGANEFERDP